MLFFYYFYYIFGRQRRTSKFYPKQICYVDTEKLQKIARYRNHPR